jgi:hypothetical protein
MQTVAGGSPLLTDLRTAQSMNLPYNELSGGIVVVPAQAAARVVGPSVTVVPAARAEPVAFADRDETVITELHNPRMTVVQHGADILVSGR